MRGLVPAAAALIVAGVALVALSVSEGGATLSLVVIVPVVSGSSALFFPGVVLIFAGFVCLPFALATSAQGEFHELLPEASGAPGGSSASGGVILIGPVPILFGSWRELSRRARWALVLLGAGLFTLALLALVWVLR